VTSITGPALFDRRSQFSAIPKTSRACMLDRCINVLQSLGCPHALDSRMKPLHPFDAWSDSLMTVTKNDLITALEESFFIYPPIPGMTTPISVPGISGHSSPVSNPEANMVGRARLTPQNVDDAIESVKNIFRREGKKVGWFIGPSSTPLDMPERLAAAGFVPEVEEAGMALTDLAKSIRANPQIRVERVTADQRREAAPLLARAFDMPDDVARYIVDYFAALGSQLTVMMYLAYVEDRIHPVAFADSIFLPEQPIAIMQGAATLPEYRGRGIYSTLLARRLEDARNSGMQGAVIQAVRSTSAAIVAKLGFEEVCSLQLYSWDPSSEK
jgi:GNAT superfamily N-acetyltransferase